MEYSNKTIFITIIISTLIIVASIFSMEIEDHDKGEVAI